MATGNITLLFHFCGMLQSCMSMVGIPIKFIPVLEWKGTLPKKIMNTRTIKKYGNEESEDILDSIGLGHYYLSNKDKCEE